jgi:Domain of unknown function (DUF4259)
VGTWGSGLFDNDDALDLLDALSEHDTVARRQVLERIFREAQEHPGNLNFTFGAAEVVAAVAVVAAGLPAGGAVAREITRHDYDLTAPGLDRPSDGGAGPPDHGRARFGLLPRPAPARSGTAPWSLDGLRKARHC